MMQLSYVDKKYLQALRLRIVHFVEEWKRSDDNKLFWTNGRGEPTGYTNDMAFTQHVTNVINITLHTVYQNWYGRTSLINLVCDIPIEKVYTVFCALKQARDEMRASDPRWSL